MPSNTFVRRSNVNLFYDEYREVEQLSLKHGSDMTEKELEMMFAVSERDDDRNTLTSDTPIGHPTTTVKREAIKRLQFLRQRLNVFDADVQVDAAGHVDETICELIDSHTDPITILLTSTITAKCSYENCPLRRCASSVRQERMRTVVSRNKHLSFVV